MHSSRRPLSEQLEIILDALGDRVKRRNPAGESEALCPAHDDGKNPSLSVRAGDKKVVLFCQSQNCRNDEILKAIGLDWATVEGREEPRREEPKTPGKLIPGAWFVYEDEDGVPILRVERKPYRQGEKKKFVQYTPVPGTNPVRWVSGSKGKRKVPFRYRELIAGDDLVWAEGERNVLDLVALGFNAGTTPQGAGNFELTDPACWAKIFPAGSAKKVAIFYDRDKQGVKYAKDAVDCFMAAGAKVRLVELPGVLNGVEVNDISDAIEAGWTAEDIRQAIAEAKDIEPDPAGGEPDPDFDFDPGQPDCPVGDTGEVDEFGRAVINLPEGNIRQAADILAVAMVRHKAPVFRAGQKLVAVEVFDETTKAANAHALPLCDVRAQHWISSTCATRVQKYSKKAKRRVWVVVDCPLDIVKDLARGQRRFPELKRLSQGPVYLAGEDRILNTPGYDRASGTFVGAAMADLVVPETVDRPAAVRAAKTLLGVTAQFPWESAKDQLRWLADVLAAVVSGGGMKQPASCYTAPTKGSGKSYLGKLPAIIATGKSPAAADYPKNDEELGKTLSVVAGSRYQFCFFDNLSRGEFGSEVLDRFLTEGDFYRRSLGSNTSGAMSGGPADAKLIFTGNNIAPKSDTVERVLVVRLGTSAGGRRAIPSDHWEVGDAIDFAQARRSDLLAAAITILRGYRQHLADGGEPGKGEAWAPFREWVAAAVDPIRWALGADPLAGLSRSWSEEDSETANLEAFVAEFSRLLAAEHGGDPFAGRFAPSELLEFCQHENPLGHPRRTYDQRFAEAVEALVGPSEWHPSRRSVVTLGMTLKKYAGIVVQLGSGWAKIARVLGRARSVYYALAEYRPETIYSVPPEGVEESGNV